MYIVIDRSTGWEEPLKMWVLIEIDGEDIFITDNSGEQYNYVEITELYEVKLYRRPPEGE